MGQSSSRIARGDRSGLPAEASFSQERLWFIERLAPSSCVFNQLNGFVIRGAVDRESLGRSVLEVVRRHEALRTNLVFSGGKLRQVVAPLQDGVFRFIDASEAPEGGMVRGEAMALEWISRPFDLSNDPLFRAVLFKTGDGEHLLALLSHHSVFDGWSLRVFANELVSIYSAVVEGRDPALAEPEVQYSDYSAWQRALFDGGEYGGELEYWIGKVGKEAPVLELPTDRPRKAQQSYRGRLFTTFLPPALRDGLRRLGVSNGCTLYMTLLAAFYALLSRYTGGGDLVVGCPVAGRGRTELEGAIGFFVNTLPLRVDLADDPPFTDLMKRVRALALEAYANQDLPFDKIVERLGPERDLSRSPVYQVMLQLRNFPGPQPSAPAIRLERHRFGWATAQVDLFMDLTEEEEGIRCDMIYPPELFDEATVERMAGHWRRMLEGVVGDPNLRVSMLPMMSGEELRRALVDWNDTKTEYPRDKCVHQLFEERVLEKPESVAMTHGEVSLTYREVNERANRLARFLSEEGIARGEPVGVCMERSIEMVITYLAILKAGGAYVPLDPNDPPQRLSVIVADMHGRVIVTTSKHEGRLPEGSRRICLDREASAIRTRAGTNLQNWADPSGMAYVIYTSGSRGAPKGVCCHHRGIVRLVVNTNYMSFSPGDTVVHASNPTFDPTTFEVWGALLNGARLLIVNKEVLLSNQEFERLIRAEGADVLFMTTTLFHIKARHAPATFGSIRELFVGGEAMDPSSARRVLASGPPRRLINFYGPTENTGFSTFHEVREVPPDATTIPIGRNISNSTSYILDQNLRPVPPGVKGEIYVSGDGVAMGYFNNPDLTASVFIPNPFAGGIMYKTGDLGRYLPDGSLDYLGRADLQVKIRGFRVEVGEVESAIAGHPSVSLSAVVALEGGTGGRRLHAYVVPCDGAAVGAEELHAFLRGRLPDYMVPTSFTFLEAMPLTPTGKIDRRSLPTPAGSGEKREPGSRPADEMERRLAMIWQRVLGGEAVGREDNFFELGGHSLLAVQLFSLIEEQLKVTLPIATIFRAPTLAMLAQEVRLVRPDGFVSLVPLRTKGRRPPLFLVHPGGGEVYNYGRLVEALGEDQPVYGLRAAGLRGEAPLPGSIEEIASSYLGEVRRMQQRGPYHFAGWCIGAAIAFEMARQLRSSGEEVGLLGILNFEAPSEEKWNSRRVARGALMREILFLGADLLRYAERSRIGGDLEIPSRMLRLGRLGMRAAGIFPPDETILPGENYPLPPPWRGAILNLARVVRPYRPKSYDRAITVFKQEPIPTISSPDPYDGWKYLAGGGIVVFVIKGRMHGALIERPEVERTAKLLKERIDWHESSLRKRWS